MPEDGTGSRHPCRRCGSATPPGILTTKQPRRAKHFRVTRHRSETSRCSAVAALLFWEQDVAGSNPATSTKCRHGGTGRHKGLKIPRQRQCAGSIPAGGTTLYAWLAELADAPHSKCGGEIHEGSSPSPSTIFIGMQPSGKAKDFDSLIRGFESHHPSHSFTYKNAKEKSCF